MKIKNGKKNDVSILFKRPASPTVSSLAMILSGASDNIVSFGSPKKKVKTEGESRTAAKPVNEPEPESLSLSSKNSVSDMNHALLKKMPEKLQQPKLEPQK